MQSGVRKRATGQLCLKCYYEITQSRNVSDVSESRYGTVKKYTFYFFIPIQPNIQNMFLIESLNDQSEVRQIPQNNHFVPLFSTVHLPWITLGQLDRNLTIIRVNLAIGLRSFNPFFQLQFVESNIQRQCIERNLTDFY